jgi:superoxide dismutase
MTLIAQKWHWNSTICPSLAISGVYGHNIKTVQKMVVLCVCVWLHSHIAAYMVNNSISLSSYVTRAHILLLLLTVQFLKTLIIAAQCIVTHSEAQYDLLTNKRKKGQTFGQLYRQVNKVVHKRNEFDKPGRTVVYQERQNTNIWRDTN